MEREITNEPWGSFSLHRKRKSDETKDLTTESNRRLN